ncbi:hypothetical protein [Meiothermus sp.]|uniref:hypothetical protein n=1 Tax=Meiothermus sp. TaxID=1955249 RepID=UPI00261B07E9|nr:hypothetical protein [Meiothermus sp.]
MKDLPIFVEESPGEVACGLAVFLDDCHHWLGALGMAEELEPGPGLKDDPVWKSLEGIPGNLLER